MNAQETVAEKRAKIVIRITSDAIGTAPNELGKALLQSTLLSLVADEMLPDTILFMNAGVRLTTVEHTFIPILQQLDEQGTKILSCDTCLEFYDLADDLQVGGVSNIYQITKMLMQADKVITLA